VVLVSNEVYKKPCKLGIQRNDQIEDISIEQDTYIASMICVNGIFRADTPVKIYVKKIGTSERVIFPEDSRISSRIGLVMHSQSPFMSLRFSQKFSGIDPDKSSTWDFPRSGEDTYILSSASILENK
jgi:hypothetical protein